MFDGNATDVGFTSLDGDDIVLFEDLDGTVTGSAGNFVVKPLPIHMTEQCEEIDNWKMAVCPHPFGQVCGCFILLIFLLLRNAIKLHIRLHRNQNFQIPQLIPQLKSFEEKCINLS